MSRWKLNNTLITFAGRILLAPGDTLDDTELAISRSYNTEAAATVSRRPLILDNGNASGELTFTTSTDYPDKPAALRAQIDLQSWADSHTTGQLALAAGAFNTKNGPAVLPPGAPLSAFTTQAALTSLATRLTLAPHGIRLITEWSFIF